MWQRVRPVDIEVHDVPDQQDIRLHAYELAMKLFVDDIRKCPKGWHLARTVTEAIRIIDTVDYLEEISIDHDISHDVSVPGSPIMKPYPCGETFEPVVRFIVRVYGLNWDVEIPKITLHTANPVGAGKMRELLQEVGLTCTVWIGQS